MPHGNSKKVRWWRNRLQRGRAGVRGTRGQGQVSGLRLVHLSEPHQPLTAPWVLPPLTFPPWLPEFLSSSTSSWDFHCLHSAFPGQLRPSRPSCLSHSFQPSQAPSERERATPCSRPHHPLTSSPFWKPTPPTCTTLSSSSHCHPPRQGHVLALP